MEQPKRNTINIGRGVTKSAAPLRNDIEYVSSPTY